jgi:hypothetical protein
LLDLRPDMWRLINVNGSYEPLYDFCRPHLRWSQRGRSWALQRKARDRLEQADWTLEVGVVPRSSGTDLGHLTRWLRSESSRPILCTEPAESPLDPLATLLKAGVAFMAISPEGLSDAEIQKIKSAVAEVPPPARRDRVPEQLMGLNDGSNTYALLWDDPAGRDGHQHSHVGLDGPTRETGRQ